MQTRIQKLNFTFAVAILTVLPGLTLLPHGATAQNVFPSSGNAGIGTTSPSDSLHARSTTNGAIVNLTTDGFSNAERGLKILTNTGGSSTVRWKIGTPANAGGEPSGNIGTDFAIERFDLYGSSLGFPFFIERGSGNVGIGTSAPGQSFSLNGNVEIKGNNATRWFMTDQDASGSTRLSFQAGGGSTSYGGGLHLWGAGHSGNPGWVTVGLPNSAGSGNTEARFTVNNGGLADGIDVFTVLRSGKVGIGTTSPGVKLEVDGGFKATGAVDIPASSYFRGNAAAGFRFNNAADTLNLMRILNNGNVLIENGNVGIGTPTPGYKLEVSGEINATGLRINGTPISNSSSPWTGSGSISYNGGNVGIGTSDPSAALSIVSPNLNGLGVGYQGSGSNRLMFAAEFSGTTAAESDVGFIGYGPTSAGGSARSIAFGSYTGSEWKEVMRMQSGGNVGIGTTDPSTPLSMGGSWGNSGLTVGNGSASSGVVLHSNASSPYSSLRFGTGAGGLYDQGFVLYNHNANFMSFGTARGTRMTIDSSGNVGIGTATPGVKLEVNGGFKAIGAVDVPASSYFRGNAAAGFRFNNEANSLNLMRILDNGNVLIENGNVGIGTPTPGYKLEVSGEINATGLRINGTPISNSSSPWTGSGSISYNGGNVGIGTATPGVKLEVDGGFKATGAVDVPASSYFRGNAAAGFRFNNAADSLNLMRILDNGNVLIENGNVGIGTPNPGSFKLNVNGDTNVSGNLNIAANGSSPGNIVAAGTIYARYQDVAEWVPSSEQLAAGTVVVLDSTKSNQVISSTTSYDTRVAGVISAQPGIALGEKGEGKVLVATTGRVKIKVDASKAPIQIGDLLVTSDTPGVAMKSEAVNLGGVQFHRPGTLIGKALEPLAKGKGEILVLLSLQ